MARLRPDYHYFDKKEYAKLTKRVEELEEFKEFVLYDADLEPRTWKKWLEEKKD